jgi:hypothetical protein
VVGFGGPAIGEIRRTERDGAAGEFGEAPEPEGIKIDEVTGVLLRGPFSFSSPQTKFGRRIAEEGLENRGSGTQAEEQFRIPGRIYREIEAAFKPWGERRHRVSG